MSAPGDLERAATLHGMAAAMLEHACGEWPSDEHEQHKQTFVQGIQRGVRVGWSRGEGADRRDPLRVGHSGW